MDSKAFVELYASSNILSKAQDMRKAGIIKVDVIKNWITLAVKGYVAIYTALPV